MKKQPMEDRSSGRRIKFGATWLAVAVGIGAAVGVATKNPALGIGIGCAIGVSVGAAAFRQK